MAGSMMRDLFLRCLPCGHEMAYLEPFQVCSRCESDWLSAVYDYRAVEGARWIDREQASMWRYRRLLPLRDLGKIVSMSEGWTPLSRLTRLGAKLGHERLHAKEESCNPTGSFKARQASLVTSVLVERGIREMVLCSTGNAAMAFAAYCARADVSLTAFLPDLVPPLKEKMVRLFGANVIQTGRSYYDTRAEAKAYAREKGLLYYPGADNFVNREAMKTIAFEMWEQLGQKAPDWYIQAVNGGPGPMGVSQGFHELRQMGLIDRVPKIGCVQSERCSPMVDSFHRGLDRAEPVVPTTRIVSLSYGTPGYSFHELSRIVRETGGTMLKVDEDRAFERIRELAVTEGRFLAPAAAVAVEGTIRMIEDGTIGQGEVVVIALTGDGVYAHELSL
jgi:threonine synthase